MANELRIASPGTGNLLYAILRRTSDGYVWQTTTATFVTFNAANIANYDIPLTDQGGDYYAADMPTGVAAGTTLTVFYYEQASGTPGTPGTSDTILGTVTRTWDGDALSSTSTVTLSGYALTTLAAVKRFMRITGTDDDTLLTQLINAASARIESLAGRNLAPRDHTEWLNASCERRLVLHNYPIIHVDRVASGARDGITIGYSGAAVSATAAVSTTGIRLRTVNTAGSVTVSSLTFAAYPTTSLMATAIAAVSGWTATALVNVSAYDLIPSSFWSMSSSGGNQSNTLSVVGEDDIGWRVDSSRGILTVDTWTRYGASTYGSGRAPQGTNSVLVSYRAGYDPIPDDLASICDQVVQAAYNEGRVNPLVNSESIGDYSYSLADGVKISDRHMRMIQSYGEIAVGSRA